MAAAERFAEAEGRGQHDEDDEGAEVGPQVSLHGLFDHAGEGEDTHHAEGEEQLEGQDAVDLDRARDTSRLPTSEPVSEPIHIHIHSFIFYFILFYYY